MAVTHTIGRRKTSVARIFLSEGKGAITVNNKDYKQYFDTAPLHYKVEQAFLLTETMGNYDVKINVDGGGITGQAEAVRHAIARALVKIDEEYEHNLSVNYRGGGVIEPQIMSQWFIDVDKPSKKLKGKTLKESFSNAGVKFDKEDKVIPPTGSGLFVRSSANNLKIVQQVINSSLSSLHTIDDPEKIRAILTKHTWKGLERPVP